MLSLSLLVYEARRGNAKVERAPNPWETNATFRVKTATAYLLKCPKQHEGQEAVFSASTGVLLS